MSSRARLKKFTSTYITFALKQFVAIHLLILLVGVTGMVGVASAALKGFDHFNTDFPLSGKHSKSACDACHLNGVFKGTPLKCSGCHNEKLSKGKNAKHIASNDDCDSCHTTFNFSKATVDHGAVIGVCTACHQAPAGHLKTKAMCDDCHSAFVWTPARFDHNNIDNQKCKDCHHKGSDHMASSGEKCENCHTTDTWKTPFDHSTTTVSCESCHLQDKRGNHYPTSNACGDCHNTLKWSEAQFEHSKTVSQKCKDCHNKGLNHLEPSSDKCKVCHSTDSWHAKFDHLKLTAACETCHLKDKTALHPDTSDECASCHTATKWADRSFNHSSVTECRSCHRDNEPKSQGHPSTSDECDACHGNIGESWDFSHHISSKNYECVFCHNGTITAGKSKEHPKATEDCGTCHSTSGWSQISKFDHSGVTDCRSCHNKKQPKAKSHPDTSAECDLCHTDTGFNWTFTHIEATNNFDCVICHNGGVSIGKNASHPKSPDKCVSCHTIRNWQPKPGAIDHSSFKTCNECHNYTDKTHPEFKPKHVKTSAECIDCHRTKGVNWSFGNHKAAEALLSCKECHANDQARTKHPDTSPDCKACHKTSPATWSDFVHPFPHVQTKSTCQQCHNLLQENPAHFDTSGDCSECHISTATWSTSGKPDHSVVSRMCIDCHNGSSATGKNPSRHIPSAEQCEQCHNNSNWRVSSRTTHKNSSARHCFDCHSGKYPGVNRRSAGHVASSNKCGDCHTTKGWATRNTDHALYSETCGACHVPPPIPMQHFDIETFPCEECHNNTNRWAQNAWYNHTQQFVNLPPHKQDCKACHPSNSRIVNWNTTYQGTCASCHERDFSEQVHTAKVSGYEGPLSSDKDMWECGTSCHSTASKHSIGKF